MALFSDPWRPIRVSEWDWLGDVSPMAQRVWFWLTTSRESTPSGLLRVRLYMVVGALKTKPAAVRSALGELESAGKLTFNTATDRTSDAPTIYLTLWLTRQLGVKSADRLAMLAAIDAVADGAAKSQAREDWEIWNAACRKADRQPAKSLDAGSKQQEQEQEQEDLDPIVDLDLVRARPGAKPAGKPFQPPTHDQVESRLEELDRGDAEERYLEAAAYIGNRQRTGWLTPTGMPIADWIADLTYWLASGQMAERRRAATKGGGAFEIKFGK